MNWDKQYKKYIEGETCLSEEQELKRRIQETKNESNSLIDYFNEEKKNQRNMMLEQKLENLLEHNKTNHRFHFLRNFIQIAAIAILMIGIGSVIIQTRKNKNENQLTEAQLSYADIALLQKSIQKLNKTIDYKKNTMELPDINYKEINKKKINENIYPFKIKPLKTGY